MIPPFNVILNETSIHRIILRIEGHLQCQKVNLKVNIKVKKYDYEIKNIFNIVFLTG